MLGAFEPLGIPISMILTLVCLVILFKMQWRGTSKVGGAFGWFMIAVWFPWIALKGLPWVVAHPEVFLAINPVYAVSFLASFPWIGALVILGVVVLAITGGEAKYADIGHFSRSSDSTSSGNDSIEPSLSGRIPVMYSWFMIVLPCLILCYAGQIAYMIDRGVPPREYLLCADSPGWRPDDRPNHPGHRRGDFCCRGHHRFAGIDHRDVQYRQASDGGWICPPFPSLSHRRAW